MCLCRARARCDPWCITSNIKPVSLPKSQFYRMSHVEVTTGFQCMSSQHNHTAYDIAQKQHKDLLFPCFPLLLSTFSSPTQVLRSETTMAFDMEIKPLIWSYILLLRHYTRYVTIQRSRQIDEIFSKHWHFCHETLSSPLKCQRQHCQDTLFRVFV